MLTWIREKFGTVLISIIIGFIAFVFIFFGIVSPKATRGLHEGAVAGKVNGDSITIAEFTRELNRRLEFFKNLAGGKISEEQLKMFRVRDGVFQELVNRKLMGQAAQKAGLVASDEEVRSKIMEIPAFQKEGKFDASQYKQVLAANNYSPGSFERLMREDLSVQAWGEYFKNRVHVSDEEIRREYLISQDKRNIKYVLLTHETGSKGVQVGANEIKAYLADAAKANLVKNQFEAKKDRDYKNQTLDQVKEKLARENIAMGKSDEIKKINEGLAVQVAGLLKADKASDAKINALLKPYGTEVRTTGMISRANRFIPGVGEAKDLMKDAFAKSTAEPQAKKYNTAQGTLISVVVESQKADLAKFEEQRSQLLSQISQRKERELFEAWMKQLTTSAKIEKNEAVVGDAPAEEAGG